MEFDFIFGGVPRDRTAQNFIGYMLKIKNTNYSNPFNSFYWKIREVECEK